MTRNVTPNVYLGLTASKHATREPRIISYRQNRWVSMKTQVGTLTRSRYDSHSIIYLNYYVRLLCTAVNKKTIRTSTINQIKILLLLPWILEKTAATPLPAVFNPFRARTLRKILLLLLLLCSRHRLYRYDLISQLLIYHNIILLL